MKRTLAFERLLAALESGDIDRREFLRRAGALGVGATGASWLIQACGDRSGGHPSASTSGAGFASPAVTRPIGWLSHPPHRTLPIASPRPIVDTGRAFFIAPGGNDRSGNGSEGRPWQSWRKARTVLGPGDTLYHRGGTYFMHGRCQWNTDGTRERPITLRAYPGELPIITAGHREFFDDPDRAWEPVPASEGGVEHEFRSTATFSLTQATVAGLFTDSFIPLVRYSKLADFRSENEFNIRETDPRSRNHGTSIFNNRADTTIGLWCGPGARWDSASGKIHVRLRHTNRYWLDHEDYLGIGPDFVTNNYKGEVDPSAMPLLLCGYRNDGAMIKLFASHLHVLDIVFAANFRVETRGDRQFYDGCWFYTGDGPGLSHRATNTRITRSR
ncbi:MAG TPA: hypothetical protein VFH69_09765, partial [Gemmatimonadota bacterium]|nr:hypothetical protein [Gemmatimonadota bacterium]